MLRDKNQTPRQTRAALVNVPAEFSNGKAGVSVRASESLQHKFERLGNLSLTPGRAHDFFEPFGKLNPKTSGPPVNRVMPPRFAAALISAAIFLSARSISAGVKPYSRNA